MAQEGLIDSFVGKVKQAIDECGLSGGALTEQHLHDIFEGFSNECLKIRGSLGLVFLICGINGRLETQFMEFLP